MISTFAKQLIAQVSESVSQLAEPKSLVKSSLQSPMLQATLAQTLESAITHALRHAPASAQQLERLAGKTVRTQVSDWLCINIEIQQNTVRINFLNDDLAVAADASVTGSGSDFASLLISDDKVHGLINGQIDIAGDSRLVMSLAKIADQLDIDFEALIQPVTGSLLAHWIGKSARSSSKWASSTQQSFKQSSQSYLQDEAEILIAQPLAQDFYQQVSDVQLASDRMAAKIAKLAQQIQEKKSANINKDK